MMYSRPGAVGSSPMHRYSCMTSSPFNLITILMNRTMDKHVVALLVACVLLGCVTARDSHVLENGRNVQVRKFVFPSSIRDYWSTPDDDNVFVLSGGHVFQSKDTGKSWGSLTQNTPQLSQGIITDVDLPSHFSTVQVVLVTSANATYVVATKTGASKSVTLRGSGVADAPSGTYPFDKIGFHPTDPKMAYAVVIDPQCRRARWQCKMFLYIADTSADPPFTQWSAVASGYGLAASFSNKNAKERNSFDVGSLFVVSRKELTDYTSGTLVNVDYMRLRSTKKLIEGALGVIAIGNHTFAATYDKKSKTPRLYLSENNFRTYEQALFSGTSSPDDEDGDVESSYAILDAYDTVFVNVFFGGTNWQQPWGHTYESGLGGKRYTMSLRYNRRLGGATSSSVDFHRVNGIGATVIANVVDNPENTRCRQCNDNEECTAACVASSRISRDNGRTWQHLTAPAETCPNVYGSAGCWLHVHGHSSALRASALSGIYSSRFAPGLIVALGNVGEHLNGDGHDASVFISQDGGETWQTLASGPHLFGETDFGGFVFIVPAGRIASSMKYTLNAGQSWSTLDFGDSSNSYFFDRILRTANSPESHFVTLFGQDSATGKGVAFFFDFDSAKGRYCAGISTPGTASSDYEYFTPRSYYSQETGGERCLLGKIVKYVRKKAGAECWQDVPSSATDSFVLPTFTKRCGCTFDDYECDYGYEQSADGMNCTRNPKQKPLTPQEQCAVQGADVYEVTRGYQKIDGDSCEGTFLDPDVLSCKPASSNGFLHFVLVAFIVALLCYALRTLHLKNERFHDAVDVVVVRCTFFLQKHVGKYFARYQPLSTTEEDPYEENNEEHAHNDVVGQEVDGEQPHPPMSNAPSKRTALKQPDDNMIEVE